MCLCRLALHFHMYLQALHATLWEMHKGAAKCMSLEFWASFVFITPFQNTKEVPCTNVCVLVLQLHNMCSYSWAQAKQRFQSSFLWKNKEMQWSKVGCAQVLKFHCHWKMHRQPHWEGASSPSPPSNYLLGHKICLILSLCTAFWL